MEPSNQNELHPVVGAPEKAPEDNSWAQASLLSLEESPLLSPASPGGVIVGSTKPPPRIPKRLKVILIILFLFLLLIGCGLLLLINHRSDQQAANLKAAQAQLEKQQRDGKFDTISTDEATIGTLKVNDATVTGQLRVDGNFVLSPQDRPSNPVKGEIYYDKTTNTPYYYNGTEFVSLVQGGSSSGTIDSSGTSSNATYVTSLQGRSGDVTLNGGSGIDVNSTTISNSGVLSITGTANQLNVSASTGNVTLSLPQDIAASSIPTFGGLKLANTSNSNLSLLQPTAPTGSGTATYVLPAIVGGSSDTVCLVTLANCAGSGAPTGPAGGDLSGTYPNPGIAKLQGTTLTVASLVSGDVLQYNGSAIVNAHITNANLTAGNFANITGVGALTSGSIASGFGTISTGSNITTTATLQGGTVNTTGQYQVNGVQISSANLSNDSNLAKLNGTGPQTFTGDNKFTGTLLSKNTSNSTNAFEVQSAGGAPLLTVNTTDGLTVVSGTLDNASLGPELRSGNCSGTNWSGSGNGPYTHSAGSTAALICTVSGGVVPDAVYQVTYNATPSNQNTVVTPEIGGITGTDTTGTVTSQVQLIPAFDTTSPRFTISTSSDTGTISNISFKVLTISKAALAIADSTGFTQIEVRGSDGVTAFGLNALSSNTTGTSNTSVGFDALQNNTSGDNNSALGVFALTYSTTGSDNSAFGQGALFFNTTGSRNTAIGSGALSGNIVGNNNTALGVDALGFLSGGGNNVALGTKAGVGGSGPSLFTGSNNTFLGYEATGDSGLQNATAIGTYAQVSQNDSLVLGCAAGVNDCTVSTKVGIDKASPAHTLDVAGDGQFQVDSATAFQVLSAGSTSYLLVNTSGAAVTLGNGTGATAVNLNTGTGSSLNLGTNAVAHTVTIGNGTSGTSVVVNCGTGACSFGTNGTAHTSTVGSTNGGSTTTIQGGTGGVNLGTGGIANTVQIGNTSGAVAQTVNVGTSGAASSTNTVNIGSTVGSSATNIRAGSGNITISAANIILGGTVTGGTLTADIAGTATSNAVCHSGGAGASENVQIVACTGSIVADYAESYPVATGADYGDIVATGTHMVNTYNTDADGNADWNSVKGQVTQLVKSSASYQASTIGIVSDNHNAFTLAGNNIKSQDNPKPVALNGRVPVKVSAGSAAIEPGDYLTTSPQSGKAMKATGAGFAIGKALEAWDPGSGKQTVMVFVEPGYYAGPSVTDYVQNGGSAAFTSLNLSGAATLATLQVTGSARFAGSITVGGHLITASGQPAGEARAAAGGSASVSVDGTDTTGTITITTGSSPSAGDMAKITFTQTYGQTPHIVLSPSNDKAAELRFYRGQTTATDFILNALDNPAPNTTYKFDYFIAQ